MIDSPIPVRTRSPLLSTAQASACSIRPFVGLVRGDARALADAFEAAYAEWSVDWCRGAGHSTNQPTSTSLLASNDVVRIVPRWHNVCTGLWWGLLPQSRASPIPSPMAAVGRTLFGADSLAPGSVAEQAAQAALNAWQLRLRALSTAADGRPDALPTDWTCALSLPANVSRPWSGAVAIAHVWCNSKALLVLSSAVVDRWLARHPEGRSTRLAPRDDGEPITPVLKAAESAKLRVNIQLAPTEIALGSLLNLRVGDVMRTVHPLDVPLQVLVDLPTTGADSTNVCSAFLGQQQGHRAAELQP